MRSIRIWRSLAAGILALPLVAGSALGQELEKFVIVNAGTGLPYTLSIIADKKGYYKEEGLDAELTTAGTATDAVAALTSGDADVISAGMPQFVATSQQGLPLWAIAPATEGFTLSLLIGNEVMEKAGITKDSSLQEKMKGLASVKPKIGLSRVGSSTDQFIRYLCVETGVDCDKDMELVPLGAVGAVLAAFDQRQIDGMVRTHPEVEMGALKSNGTVLISGPAGDVPSLDGFLYVVYGTSDRQIESRGEQLDKFMRAYGKAIKFVQAYPDEARAIMFEAIGGTEKDVFDAAWAQMLPTFSKDPVIDAAGVNKTLDVIGRIEGKRPEVAAEKLFRVDIAEKGWQAISSFEPKS